MFINPYNAEYNSKNIAIAVTVLIASAVVAAVGALVLTKLSEIQWMVIEDQETVQGALFAAVGGTSFVMTALWFFVAEKEKKGTPAAAPRDTQANPAPLLPSSSPQSPPAAYSPQPPAKTAEENFDAGMQRIVASTPQNGGQTSVTITTCTGNGIISATLEF